MLMSISKTMKNRLVEALQRQNDPISLILGKYISLTNLLFFHDYLMISNGFLCKDSSTSTRNEHFLVVLFNTIEGNKVNLSNNICKFLTIQ